MMYDALKQRMDALERANEIRTARRELKEALRGGETTLKAIFNTEGEDLGTMKLREMLLSIPGVGPKKADRALRQNELSPAVTLGRLDSEDRKKLLAWFVVACPDLEGIAGPLHEGMLR